jgi:hypothetical protein
MILNEIMENYSDEEILIADGFNSAIVGFYENDMKVVYSIEKCIEILCLDMSEEEAEEYFYYNVFGSYIGENTPMFIYTFPIDKQIEREIKLKRICNQENQ